MQQKDLFLTAWVRNHILAYAIGLGVLQPLIAHGFTGDHDVELTPPQLAMHTLSLVVFACIVTVVRNKTFQLVAPIKLWTGLLPALVFFPSFFWLGYYTLYVPFDILFSLLCIGFLNGWYMRPFLRQPNKWLWHSLLAAFCGALAGIASGIGCYFWFIKDMKGIAGDFTIWLLISIPASVVSSLLGRRFLKKEVVAS